MRDRVALNMELLTPAFVSGADQNEARLSGSTVRGLLRWWWRAVVGHDHGKNALRDLRDKEAQVFGSAGAKLKSPVIVRVFFPEPPVPIRPGRRLKSDLFYDYERGGRTASADVLPYLGYGPMDFRGTKRPGLEPGTRFRLELSWLRGSLSTTDAQSVLRAVAAWSTLGGIGSRSRNGWGALRSELADVDVRRWPVDPADVFTEQCRRCLESAKRLPDYVAPFPQLALARVSVDPTPQPDWTRALGRAGLVYKALRPTAKRMDESIPGFATGTERRAASLLISVVRGGEGLRGVLAYFLCRPKQRSAPRDDDGVMEFARCFSDLTAREWRKL